MTWKYKALLHAKREDPSESVGLLLNIKGKEKGTAITLIFCENI